MNVGQLLSVLEAHGDKSLRIVLPSGEAIPSHFHVTEVGRIDKDFVDCGGTRRQTVSCSLQTWTASDIEHRLTAGKLAKIFQLAAPVLKSVDLPVEVEYGPDVASQYHLSDVEVLSSEVVFVLVGKQTDCLARDRCGVSECSTTDCCC